jgi:apolipoprotein D and lipocalin family protein
LLENGKIAVLNKCSKKSFDGRVNVAKGKAYVADAQTNAKLRVSFFWPFYGDYWIIHLDNDYQYAVVGEPNRQYLWVLYRKPVMDSKLYSEILAVIKSRHYNPDLLIMTPQKK